MLEVCGEIPPWRVGWFYREIGIRTGFEAEVVFCLRVYVRI
jgi:hypothetical protein